MVENNWKILLGGALAAMLPFSASAEITCTATPDCASLGYSKTAAECPSGGVKCPFNSNLMFCLKNTTAYNFQLQVPTKLYNVVYHDGSTSTSYSYNANKTPIGIVAYIYPKSGNMHGIIMSREQPIVGTYAEAIEYCNNYSVKGTNVGDWRLPNIMELMWMGSTYSLGKQYFPYDSINSKLALIRWANPLYFSSNWSYNVNSGSPNGTLYGASNASYKGWEYWSTNDAPAGNSGNAYTHILNSVNNVYQRGKTGYYHFRCVMTF
jgi:hypothetical protein